jgi:UDP-N-acetylmuramate: L-alanyl-gamma-D-glutamyl-meso-diaminopimelate ligase
VTVYDDFAHHPTAIEATLQALRAHVKQGRIVAILHLASNSMKMGIYNETLGPALKEADIIFVLKPQSIDALAWTKNTNQTINMADTVDELVNLLVPHLKPRDHVLVMSNGDFNGIHEKILNKLGK